MSTSPSMLRSVAAVLAGYTLFLVATVVLYAFGGRDPHAAASARVILGSTLYGTGFAALAGLLAARLAGGRALFHSGAIAAVIALSAVVSLVTRAPGAPLWSHVTALAVMAPAALLGGVFAKPIRPRT